MQVSITSEHPTVEEAKIILIDKPVGWTSFDVVKKLKFACKIKKIGHAGTLDPLATGLLILCTGKMTKQIDTFQAQTKLYSGVFVLGKTTPSIDLETEFDGDYAIININEDVLKIASEKLTGEIDQIPPIYSAIQVNGKRLYEYARSGKDVEIKQRKVSVYSFEIDSGNFPEIKYKIKCSKGTYIRSLIRDFGTLCNSGAYSKDLRREKIGEFDVKDAYTIEDYIKEFGK